MEEKLLIFREPTKTIIAYDYKYFKVNSVMIEKLVRRSVQYGQTIGCDLSRAQFGEIVCHTNPSTISKKWHEEAIAKLEEYILSCSPD